MYTLKKLKQQNSSYDSDHRVTRDDVKKANRLVRAIEQSRSDTQPVIGDRVIYTDEYGTTYDWALFDGKSTYHDSYSLCERSYTPFVYLNKNGGISLSVSGGAFPVISEKELKQFKLVRKALSRFCAWGHCGATATGAFDFQAQVNLWSFTRNGSK
jgi:hypothetical protein